MLESCGLPELVNFLSESDMLSFFSESDNRTILTGTVDTAPRESKYIKDLFVFRLRISGIPVGEGCACQDTLVNVCILRGLYETLQLCQGEWIVLDGEFRSYYKRMALYRPIIHIYADKVVRMLEGPPINRVCFEGGIMKDIVVITNLAGERSATCLCLTKDSAGGFVELPCVIKTDSAGLIDGMQKGERYRMYGRITSRLYKKRLGRNKFEEELMNELTISHMTKALVKSPNDKAACT